MPYIVLTCLAVANANSETGFARTTHVLAPFTDTGPARGTVSIFATVSVLVAHLAAPGKHDLINYGPL